MTLREINDICISKINGTMGEAEIPKEFWENVGRLANDLVDQEWREKQIPKKPTYHYQYYPFCPICNTSVKWYDPYGNIGYLAYCPNCGQRMDWSEIK